jgi:hypothetical protein
MKLIAAVCSRLVIIIAVMSIGTTGAGPPDALAIQSTTCTATIDSSYSLHIPVLDSKSLFIKTDFVYEHNPAFPALIPFKLTNVTPLQSWGDVCAVSTLSSDLIIHIPDVILSDGISRMWVDMEYSQVLSSDESAYFVVTNYGVMTNAHQPLPNPYLAEPLYAISHFDSSQSDSTPYGPPRNSFTVDTSMEPIVYGGPINIITLASTKRNFMWQVGTDRVSCVYKEGEKWNSLAVYQALAEASNNLYPAIPNSNFRAFGESSAVGMNTTSMDNYLKGLFGDNYGERMGNGAYSLVDNNNVLYACYYKSIYGFALIDPVRPSAGITIRYKLDDVINVIDPSAPSGTKLCALVMTYDGHLVIGLTNGVAVIDRDLNSSSKQFYRFADNEIVSNSIAVDENNGIYVASNYYMRKLVWNGSTLSGDEKLGAWSCPYDNSGSERPPIVKFTNGTGSTPTLMGFGSDNDKLVIITDGAKQMKLVAFWRNEIPAGFSSRVAGQIQVTCGFKSMPEWIQSEQSVVVSNYGAFVVNNIPQTVPTDIQNKSNILQISLMGPAYPTAYGVERFQWNPSTHQWSSVWARSDVSSTSMVPIHSQSGNMAIINGYRPAYGWEVLGLDWNTGDTAHHTIFGDANLGNGAYAILQFLEDGDMIFNSFCGPLRIHY